MRTLVLALVVVSFGSAKALGQSVSIAPYKGNKIAAFSFTLDDGYRASVIESRQVFAETGVQATYFLMPRAMGTPKAGLLSWDEAKQLLEAGHEIGGHARVNPKLHEVDAETLETIVHGGWKLYEEKLGYRARSFAMPGGSKRTPEVEQVIYRDYDTIREGDLVKGWGAVNSENAWPVEKTRAQIVRVIESGGWGMAVIHAITKGYRPFSSVEHFKAHVEAVTAERDRVWIAPMGEVARYIDTAAKATVTHTVEPGGVEIRLGLESADEGREAALLTLVIDLDGKGSEEVVATQAGEALAVVRKGEAFLIDVQPGREPVKLSWK